MCCLLVSRHGPVGAQQSGFLPSSWPWPATRCFWAFFPNRRRLRACVAFLTTITLTAPPETLDPTTVAPSSEPGSRPSVDTNQTRTSSTAPLLAAAQALPFFACNSTPRGNGLRSCRRQKQPTRFPSRTNQRRSRLRGDRLGQHSCIPCPRLAVP